jgi:hypothetical protein
MAAGKFKTMAVLSLQLLQANQGELPCTIALPLQQAHAFEIEIDRVVFCRHPARGFGVADLNRPVIHDLNFFDIGCVFQHFEIRVRGPEFLIFSLDGLLADRRRATRIEAHPILRPDIYLLSIAARSTACVSVL